VSSRDTAADTDTSFFHAGWNGADTFRFSFDGSGSDDGLTWTDPNGSSVGQWHHWAGTFNKDTNLVKIFKDGQMVASKVLTTGDLNIAKQVFIGGATDGAGGVTDGFAGLLDEVRIWGDLRTDPEHCRYLQSGHTR